MEINHLKNKVFLQKDLTVDESVDLFDLIMNGKLSEIDISAILIALKLKGEAKNEIFGASKIMRSKSMKISSCSILKKPSFCWTEHAGIGARPVQTKHFRILRSYSNLIRKTLKPITWQD